MKIDSQYALLFTCEHATNAIPKAYQPLFKNAQAALNSHRGYDPGAIEVAKSLARKFNAPLLQGKTSRLLVELNRTLKHPKLWSEYTGSLTQLEKEKILNSYYLPYRDQLVEQIKSFHRKGKTALHISVHSFTPVLNGVTRNADIGLLYDPSRKGEKEFCIQWQQQLKELSPNLRVRRNFPYLGKADGMVTFLRKQFDGDSYLGIELEMNQRLFEEKHRQNTRISSDIANSIAAIQC